MTAIADEDPSAEADEIDAEDGGEQEARERRDSVALMTVVPTPLISKVMAAMVRRVVCVWWVKLTRLCSGGDCEHVS